MSEELETAYRLKELFNQWFEKAKENGEQNLHQIKKELEAFYLEVEKAHIPEFQNAISTLKNWQIEILNSFAFGLSNGFVEGLNNLTKVIKRNAFGFRSFRRLRAKVLLTHQYKNIGNFIG